MTGARDVSVFRRATVSLKSGAIHGCDAKASTRLSLSLREQVRCLAGCA